MRILIAIAILLALPLPAVSAWGADTQATLEQHARAIDRAALTAEGARTVSAHLEAALGIPATTLEAQRARTKLGWGEVFIANRLAQRTGLSFDRIVGEFRAGKGWGDIAREHHLDLGQLVSDVRRSRQAVEADVRHADKGRPGTADSVSAPKSPAPDRSSPGGPGMGAGGPGVRGGGRGR
jgi:hypothetical protein